MSGILFLFVVDWVTTTTTLGRRSGIRWDFVSVLEDLDFKDDIALLSSKYEHIQEKMERLITEAGRIGYLSKMQSVKNECSKD